MVLAVRYPVWFCSTGDRGMLNLIEHLQRKVRTQILSNDVTSWENNNQEHMSEVQTVIRLAGQDSVI